MDYDFKHLLVPQGQDNIVEEIVDIFSNSEYNLVRVLIKGNKKIQIQILAENDNFNMSLNDCEIVYDIVKDQLDKNPNLYDNYSLEISSPGIERPLTRKKDFNIWSNNYVKVKLFRHDNLPRRFEAKLMGLSEEGINIFIEDDSQEISGEYDLQPLDVKEIILSWVSDKPPIPNVIG
ncbi:MAG: hypothetical protein VYC43_03280 [Pseudomonadota bacterium]|nr:hypothetical protein [Pseudomonadota bacterium]MEC9382372.1 hypothetical protein [Pseudomonadota bacterium]MEC9414576.1 hypothetical protein [Pseudomonadota bacterium]MEC9481476.1 hypothetical protein [Pseudomonadota bacterium]